MFDAGSIFSSLHLDISGFKNAISAAVAQGDRLTRNLQGISARASTLSTSLATVANKAALAGTTAAAGLGIAIKSAATFDEEMAKIATTLDSTTMDFLPKFHDELVRLSVQFGDSTSSLAKGLYDILSVGVEASEALDLLKASTFAAKAGFSQTSVAADTITSILKSYQIDAKYAADISDILFLTIKRGKIEFPQLAANIGTATATAALAGLQLEEVAAMLSTLTRAGISADESVTALNNVILTFLNPSDEGAEMARKFGFELNSATLRAEGLRSVIQKLTKATSEQIAVIFPNIRAIKGASDAIANVEYFMEDYNQLANRTGATVEAFNKAMDNKKTVLNQVIESVRTLIILVGEKFFDSVSNVAGQIIGWTDAIKGLLNRHGELVVQVGLLIAKLAILIPVMLTVSMTLPLITAAAKAATAAIALMWAAMTGPALPVIASLTAIGAAIYAITAAWRTNFMNIRKITADTIEDIINFLDPIYENVKAFTEWLFNIIKDVLEKILNMLAIVINKVIGGIAGMSSALGSIFANPTSPTVLKNAMDEFKMAWDKDYVGEAKAKILDGFNFTIATFEKALPIVKEFFADEAVLMSNFIDNAVQQAKKDFDGLIGFVKGKYPVLTDIFDTFSNVRPGATGIPSVELPGADLGRYVSNIVHNEMSVTENAMKELKDNGIRTIEAITEDVRNLHRLLEFAELTNDHVAYFNVLEKIQDKLRELSLESQALHDLGIQSDLEIQQKIIKLQELIRVFDGNKRIVRELNLELGELTRNLNEGLDTRNFTTKFTEGFREGMIQVRNQALNMAETTKNAVVSIMSTVSDGIATAFVDIFTGAQSAGEAIKELGRNIIRMLLETAARMAINFAFAQAMMALFPSLAATSAAAVASAWAPAAALVSLATLGANSIPAITGIATAVTAAQFAALAGGIGGHAEGIETVPYSGMYKLHQGEQVVPRWDATSHRENSTQFEIYNFITPEAVALAMAQNPGKNVIINVISQDSLNRGKTSRRVANAS